MLCQPLAAFIKKVLNQHKREQVYQRISWLPPTNPSQILLFYNPIRAHKVTSTRRQSQTLRKLMAILEKDKAT